MSEVWGSVLEGTKSITGFNVLAEGRLNPFEAAKNAVSFSLEGVSNTAPAPAKPTNGRSL
jgi:hypothetical protein